MLGSDCVYLEIAFQPLVDTLVELSTRQTEIYVSPFALFGLSCQATDFFPSQFCYQQRRKVSTSSLSLTNTQY